MFSIARTLAWFALLTATAAKLGASTVVGDNVPSESVSYDVHLSHGLHIPRVGLGTAGLPGKTVAVVREALAAGVRLLDSAQAEEWYSEEDVGKGIVEYCAESEGNRNQLWDLVIITKIHPRSFREDLMRDIITRSRQLFYSGWYPTKESLDVVLLHSPYCWTGHCTKEEEAISWQEAWKSLEKFKERGKIRAIGVSNFDVNQLKELEGFANTKIAIVQNWMDPLHQDVQVRKFCKDRGIVYMAYSSLGTQWDGKFRGRNPVLENKTLQKISIEHETSVAAVVASWLLQEGVITIPRASSTEHIRENAFFGKRGDDGSFPVFLTYSNMQDIRSIDGSVGVPWE